MTQYQHIIWDWNGTLLDDVWLCVDIINGMLAKRGLYGISHRRYREIFDFPVIRYYEKTGLDLNSENFESVCAEFCEAYADRVGECKLHKHAFKTLSFFAGNGITQSILSSTEQLHLEEMIHMSELNDFFEKVVGQNDYYANGKIESGEKMIAELPVNKSEILLIGDTAHDQITANAMGIDCALVPNGHHSIEKLKKTGAYVFDNLAEIVHVLKCC